MKLAIALLVLAHCFAEEVFGLVHPKYRCYGRPNEKYTNSYDSRCDSYCNVPNSPCPPIFTNVDGCYCKEGYYRNSMGMCVELWKCDPFSQPPLPSPTPSPFVFPPPTTSIEFCLKYPSLCYTDPMWSFSVQPNLLSPIAVAPIPVVPKYDQFLPVPVYPPVAYQPVRRLIRRSSVDNKK